MDKNCPMAGMCQGMINGPKASVYLTILGFVLVFVGILILIEPKLLAWLIGCMFILLGLAMFTMTAIMRARGADRQNEQ